MTVVLLICFLVFGIAIDSLSVWMKIRVNERLPEDRRLTWWSKNYGQVNRLYAQQQPNSILPDLNRAGMFLVIALFVTLIVTSFVIRN